MPGVIMENGARQGPHTNHDRDQRPNGLNGADSNHLSERLLEKGKGRAEPQQNVTPTSPTMPNGIHGGFPPSPRNQVGADDAARKDGRNQIDQLPPEIVHITQGYLSLSTLLARLAQKTHNDLSKTVTDLAQMPPPASVANGNASHITTIDDNSAENLAKKLRLLKFSQEAHTEWTKALVITNWSRRSEDVSKMIDAKVHLDQQKAFYDFAVHELSEVKRSLMHARLPNPDIKTALEVLTTGKASWMPELGYIEPPPLTAQEILKSLENLNTLLSIRLNLHEYDNIPIHFQDYTIKSGRATFRVEGEFEVDLTIADEDPETQFWFIDFRFLFNPTTSDLAPHVRGFIESRVNEALLNGGLWGCYNFLHGMVLSHKVSEFRRQAVGLARGKWVQSLKVEALNRALSIQYWVDPYGRPGPKSWIILGVHSGKRKVGVRHPKDTSRLSIRWFRDSKEVKELDVSFDTVNISTESLLKTVIAKHVNYILTSTYDKLRAKPLFANREAVLSLTTSTDEPAESELRVQLTNERHVSIRIEPITGRFIFSPASRVTTEFEYRVNRSVDPATDAHTYIDGLRYAAITEDIAIRGLSLGWMRVDNPGLRQDDLKAVIPKDASQVVWLRRPGWVKNWYIAISMGMSGERWWLIETTNPPAEATIAPTTKKPKKEANVKITSALSIPIKSPSPTPTYAFLNSLHIFAAALLSHYANQKSLYARRVNYMTHGKTKLPVSVNLPAIYMRLSELIPLPNACKKDLVKLTFQGLEGRQAPKQHTQASTPGSQSPAALVAQEDVYMITEARISMPVPSALKYIKEKIDPDIAFDYKTGALAFRLRSQVGESVIPNLIERAIRVHRLLKFVRVLQDHQKSLKCEIISLGKIVFTYGKIKSQSHPDAMDVDQSGPREYKAVVDFGTEATMSLILEPGNPHLHISDHLNHILNGEEGLNGVATLLPLTLPVLFGIDSIETSWASIPNSKGEAFMLVRSTDSYIVRYNLPAVQLPRTRKIMFVIKLRQRRGVPWWDVRRIDSRDKAGDDLDTALKPIWNSSGHGWQGMRVSAVAQASGVEELLSKIDDAVRTFALAQNTADLPQQGLAAPNLKVRPNAPGQQRQQPTPNQSQSQTHQSQGRNGSMKREIVEID